MSSVGPQAPVGAVGYRLVFPSRTPDESPRLSPQLDGNGYQGSYSLTPFQAPYDIRLCDGQLYRVIWTGAVGEIILPKQDGTIPGLRFFLSEATLNAEEGSQTETSVGESAAASNESGTDATVIPIQATEQTISRSVDDSSDFLDIPRLADDLCELVLELLDSLQDYSAWYNRRPVAQSFPDMPEIDPQKIDQYVWLAQRLFKALDKRPLQLVTINMCAKGWLHPWIVSILKFLCQNQRPEDALALYELLSSTVGETQTEEILPRLEMLLFAGQLDKAKQLAVRTLATSGVDLRVLALATETLMVSGDYALAEPHLRRYYQLARDSFQPDHFKLAVNRLAHLYAELGRKEDADRLDGIFGEDGVLAHADRLLMSDSHGTLLPGEVSSAPYVEPTPKPAKNRPCPCGSTKKYKLCCQRKEDLATGTPLPRTK